MYIYALSYRNPYDDAQIVVLFLASRRLLEHGEAVGAAISAVTQDALGHEMVEAVEHGTLVGPLEISGNLIQPSIAVTVE